MTIGSEILATDYNSIQAKVENILGVGSGTYGYGQVVRSAPVSAGDLITEEQWLNLMYDVNNVRIHQIGSATTSIEIPSVTTSIKYRATSPNFGLDTTITSLDPSRFSIAGSRSSIFTVQSKNTTGEWIKTASATLTVTFADPNQARNFFNAGAKIRIRTLRTGGSDTYQNRAWSDVLNTAGIRMFQAFSSDPNSVGFYELTDQWQPFYISSGSSIYSSLYAMNYYMISVKCDVVDNSNGGATILEFKIELIDLHTFNNAGTGEFLIPTTSPLYKDKVNGTLSMNIEELKDVSNIFPSGTWDTVSPSYSLSNISLDAI